MTSVTTYRRPKSKDPGLPAEAAYDGPRVALSALGFMGCRWSWGRPGEPHFGFCGKKAASALRPWCSEHYPIVYKPYNGSRV